MSDIVFDPRTIFTIAGRKVTFFSTPIQSWSRAETEDGLQWNLDWSAPYRESPKVELLLTEAQRLDG